MKKEETHQKIMFHVLIKDIFIVIVIVILFKMKKMKKRRKKNEGKKV